MTDHRRDRCRFVGLPLVAAHHGDRHPAGVALHQLGGAGDLVGDADLLDLELVTVRVVLADPWSDGAPAVKVVSTRTRLLRDLGAG